MQPKWGRKPAEKRQVDAASILIGSGDESDIDLTSDAFTQATANIVAASQEPVQKQQKHELQFGASPMQMCQEASAAASSAQVPEGAPGGI